MIIWNLICPKCNKKLRYTVDVCPCMASQVPLPECPVCKEKMTYDLSSMKSRRMVK